MNWPISKKNIRIVSLLLLSLVSLLIGWFSKSTHETAKTDSKTIYVEKISDGDTIEARIGARREHLRLIGIDAPELGQKPWGRESKKFLENMISDSGWQVRIEYDIERRDKYDRILAYLWDRNGKMINEEMLRNGHAVLYTIPPNIRYVERLKAAQVISRENKTGIWKRGGLRQLPSDYRKDHPRK